MRLKKGRRRQKSAAKVQPATVFETPEPLDTRPQTKTIVTTEQRDAINTKGKTFWTGMRMYAQTHPQEINYVPDRDINDD